MTFRLATFVALLATAQAASTPSEMHQDFRGKKFNDQLFRFEGPNAAQYIRPEPDGLRITLPADSGPKKPVGIVLREGIHGDFSATVTYNLLHADKPDKGSGVGVSIYLMLNSTARDGINFGRFHRRTGDHVFDVAHMVNNDTGGRSSKGSHFRPADQDILTGKMRVMRNGPLLTLSASEGDSGAFQQIAQIDVGIDPVRMLRIAADQGNSDSSVDVRIIDFRVEAEKFASAGSFPTGSGYWYWLLFGGVILLGGLIVLVRFWLAKRDQS
jgi:hypothetical protein